MKRLLLLITLISLNASFAINEELSRFPISYFIMMRPLIIEGEILEINEKQIKVSIKTVLKGKMHAEKLKIRTNNIFSNTPHKLGLELNQSYVFILGRKSRTQKYLMFQPHQRMKIQNDSLFISENNLRGVDENNDLNTHQTNTFNDPLVPKGYKISMTEFQELVFQVNETFQSVRSGRNRSKRAIGCYMKIKEIDSTATPFIQAVLKHLNRVLATKICN